MINAMFNFLSIPFLFESIQDEIVFLLYGLFLCYKAGSTNWPERKYFSISLFIEMSFTAGVSIFSVWMSGEPTGEQLLLLSFLHLNITVTPNILVILIPKVSFCFQIVIKFFLTVAFN